MGDPLILVTGTTGAVGSKAVVKNGDISNSSTFAELMGRLTAQFQRVGARQRERAQSAGLLGSPLVRLMPP